MASLNEGWYADASNTDVERFFDGTEWTDQTRTLEPGRTPGKPPSPGWYPDPKRLRDERWFDGTMWTVEARDASGVVGWREVFLGSSGQSRSRRDDTSADPVEIILRELRWIRASGIAIFVLLFGLVLIVLGSRY
jgi:hypothetical protein